MKADKETRVIYLASPYGFSSQMSKSLLPEFIEVIEGLGARVWEPFNKNSKINLDTYGCAYQIGRNNINGLNGSDAIFAIVNGTPPDEGVMIEIGIAIASKKPIFLFRDDFRKCSDSNQYPLNLMIFSGLPKQNWEEYYYKSINEISDKEKALYKYLNNN